MTYNLFIAYSVLTHSQRLSVRSCYLSMPAIWLCRHFPILRFHHLSHVCVLDCCSDYTTAAFSTIFYSLNISEIVQKVTETKRRQLQLLSYNQCIWLFLCSRDWTQFTGENSELTARAEQSVVMSKPIIGHRFVFNLKHRHEPMYLSIIANVSKMYFGQYIETTKVRCT